MCITSHTVSRSFRPFLCGDAVCILRAPLSLRRAGAPSAALVKCEDTALNLFVVPHFVFVCFPRVHRQPPWTARVHESLQLGEDFPSKPCEKELCRSVRQFHRNVVPMCVQLLVFVQHVRIPTQRLESFTSFCFCRSLCRQFCLRNNGVVSRVE